MEAPEVCLSEFLSDNGIGWLPHDHPMHVPIVAEDTIQGMLSSWGPSREDN